MAGDDAETERAEVQRILQSYMSLYSQQSWEAWIALWAEEGVLEFPFAPAGRRSRYEGKAAILQYMKATALRMAERVKVESVEYFQLRPMLDAGSTCLEMGLRGRVLESDASYEQKYISIIETQRGKISLYKEYWNPLASMDANGGREAWTAAFGSPGSEDPAA